MSNATWWRMAAAQNGPRRPRRTSWVRIPQTGEPVKVRIISKLETLRASTDRPPRSRRCVCQGSMHDDPCFYAGTIRG